MKRHPALIPLSRDHHDGLVQALRPRRAAADGDASARLAAAREFVEFFRNKARVHLRDEEEELFPLFLRHVQSQPALLREARALSRGGFSCQLPADTKRNAGKWRCPTGACQPKSTWIKASRLHQLVPRESKRWGDLYRVAVQ